MFRDDLFISVLNPQWVRSGRPYTYAPDINGDFRINTFQGSNPNTESDYSKVVFSLFAEDFLFDGEHFVVGDFNQHIISDKNKLNYNLESGRFEAELLLKQGIYNYKFERYFTKKNKNYFSAQCSTLCCKGNFFILSKFFRRFI